MLTLSHLTKSFDNKPVLRDVSLEVAAGETVCLLGPSGSGKSTILRLVAGLESPDSGRILWNGDDLAAVPVHQRRFGLVFQDYALFPHLNVAENVAYGLRMQGLRGEPLARRVQEALARVHMTAFADRQVSALSGGEQQRVALARALAIEPRLLMFDEPLGALDRALRARLLEVLRGLLRESGISALYVTHDQEEAFALGQRVLVLHAGHIEQAGTPETLVRQPATAWVAEFLGLGTLLPGEVLADGSVRTAVAIFPAERVAAAAPRRGPCRVLLRPETARVQASPHAVTGQVADCRFLPDGRYRLRLDNGVTAVLPQAFPPGAKLSLVFEQVQVFLDE